MKVLSILVCFFVLLFVLSPACRADSLNYIVNGPNGVNVDYCSFDIHGMYEIVAVFSLDVPARGLEFTMPDGYVTNPVLTFNYPVTGDVTTGAFLDFEGCLSGTVPIFEMQFEITGDWDCPGLIRGVGQSLPVLVGCDDVRRDMVPPCSADIPVLLTPPDSAMAVPLSPLMSWEHGAGAYCNEGLGVYYYTIEYGIAPDNLDQQTGCYDTWEWILDSLQPETQYFWRLKLLDGAWEYAGSKISYSDIHTFTTEGSVPTKRVTWGELKSYLK